MVSQFLITLEDLLA